SRPRASGRVARPDVRGGPGALPVVRAVCIAEGWRPAGARPSFARFVGDEGSPLVVYAGVPASLAGPLGPEKALAALRERAFELRAIERDPVVLDPADQL